MPISQKDFFAELGAPLTNARWSWGSVRSDGKVFLRVWQDHAEKHDGTLCVPLAHELDDEDEGGSLGYRERLKHIDLIRKGAACFLIMCQADDIDAKPRKVKDFDRENVRRGGKLIEIDGDCWIEIGPRLPKREVRL